MKYTSGEKMMNLPNYIKFGCEIEVQNVDSKRLKSLLKQYPQLNNWKVIEDASVTDNGVEVVSPPLSENTNESPYKDFQKVLELIKSCPADKNRNVYVNEMCGGHIHLDATKMRENPEMMESFLRLWAESEEIIYKICNAKNDPIRESAIKLTPVDGIKKMLFSGISELIKASKNAQNEEESIVTELPKVIETIPKKTIQGVVLTIAGVINKYGFAHPIGDKLQKAGKKGDYIKDVMPTKRGNKYKFDKSIKKLAYHETGINLQHIATNRQAQSNFDRLFKGKPLNTYEFRNHNSSLELETWKQNIYLDTAISKIAYEMAYEPGKNDKELSSFFEKDITEEEKVDRFLNLLFSSNEDRAIYKERWESVKDNPVFNKAKGFSRTFLRSTAQNAKSRDIVNTMTRFFNKAKKVLKNARNDIQMQGFLLDYGGREDE